MSLLAMKGKVIKPVMKLNLAIAEELKARESVDHESFEPAKTDFPPFFKGHFCLLLISHRKYTKLLPTHIG